MKTNKFLLAVLIYDNKFLFNIPFTYNQLHIVEGSWLSLCLYATIIVMFVFLI